MNQINNIEIRTSSLHKGDCLNILEKAPSESIDCIITDPPYNLGIFMHKRGTNLKKMRDNQFAYAGWDNLEFEEWQKNMSNFLEQCSRILKKRGTLIVFMRKDIKDKLVELCQELMDDLNLNKIRKITNGARNGRVELDEFKPKPSKPIFDKIDALLAEHYHFTPIELDYIVNYDVKFRMSDEL